MFVQPKQKHDIDKMLIASTSNPPCSKPNVVRRALDFFHFPGSVKCIITGYAILV